MREVPLGGPRAKRHGTALVDDKDYAVVGVYQWCITASTRLGANQYACHRVRLPDGRSRLERMHHLITGWAFVDHIDGDGLNNQRNNLRQATVRQNARNGRSHRDSSSPHRGVSWFKRDGLWHAQISDGVRNRHIGYFTSERKAARAYDAEAAHFFGEFARLNFPGDGDE